MNFPSLIHNGENVFIDTVVSQMTENQTRSLECSGGKGDKPCSQTIFAVILDIYHLIISHELQGLSKVLSISKGFYFINWMCLLASTK